MKRKPTYLIYAGVNGAGKSSLFDIQAPDDIGDAFSHRLNADEVVVRNKGDWHNERDYADAFREIIKNKNFYIKNGISFNQETTLAGHNLSDLKKAKKNGFKISMYYVGVNSADIAIRRVHNRVLKNGHGIDDNIIRDRYKKSLRNLNELIPYLDELVLIDNSAQALDSVSSPLRVIFKYSEKKVKFNKTYDVLWTKELNLDRINTAQVEPNLRSNIMFKPKPKKR